MENILNMVIQYIAEIIALVLVSAIGFFGTWLLNKIKQKKGLENIALATEQVLQASQSTVLELQQTFVETWKKNQNGKLTEEQIKTLRDSVISITLSKLAQPAVDLLTSAGVDICSMITSSVEAYVLQLKENK